MSTGAYGFPIERACGIALRETQRFLAENARMEEVRFVCFGHHDYQVYMDALTDMGEALV